MPGAVYLHLLLFCGIWSHGIIGTFADEDNKESSDFLVRQKRVISYEQDGAIAVHIEERPYIVYVRRIGHVLHDCVGTILSHRVVITSAECTQSQTTEYTVYSKSSRTYRGKVHNVTNIKVNKGNFHDRPLDGIALLTIDPAIVYGIFIKNIELHVGPLLPGMLGTVSGWGYNYRDKVNGEGTIYPTNLRSIQVPIIAHRDCVNQYRNYYSITDKDICTFHPLRHCGHSDRGAPLVIDNLLVGIFLHSGPLSYRYNREYPDVFALLQHTDYSNWIRANI